ncbi:MAG: ERF family protein [Aeromonadaceae bacterium]
MGDFYKKLIKIQSTLNAPKGQFNSFGKYNYRSCEDIMGALKPLLAAEGLFQFISDSVEVVGGRHYIKATVTVTDGETSVSNSAFAREDEQKKGMDGSQVTGASSSYARKYALNGMWNIDDSKDADTNEFRDQQAKQAKQDVKQQNKPHLDSISGQTLNAVTQWLAEGLAVEHVIERLSSKYAVQQSAADQIRAMAAG